MSTRCFRALLVWERSRNALFLVFFLRLASPCKVVDHGRSETKTVEFSYRQATQPPPNPDGSTDLLPELQYPGPDSLRLPLMRFLYGPRRQSRREGQIASLAQKTTPLAASPAVSTLFEFLNREPNP